MPRSKKEPLWGQLPTETGKLFEKFTVYRKLPPPRTLEDAAKATGLTFGYVRKLSMKYRWLERAAAWDAHLVAKEDKVIESERERLAKEHMQALALMRAHGTRALALDYKASKEKGTAMLSAKDAASLLKDAVTLERLIVGEATSREAGTVELDLDGFKPEEVEAFLAFLRRAGVDTGGEA